MITGTIVIKEQAGAVCMAMTPTEENPTDLEKRLASYIDKAIQAACEHAMRIQGKGGTVSGPGAMDFINRELERMGGKN